MNFLNFLILDQLRARTSAGPLCVGGGAGVLRLDICLTAPCRTTRPP